MKVLVIPDIHLKPWIFDKAKEILKAGKAENAVCLNYKASRGGSVRARKTTKGLMTHLLKHKHFALPNILIIYQILLPIRIMLDIRMVVWKW